MGNSQALQTKAQVTSNLLTVIPFSENLLCLIHYKCELCDRGCGVFKLEGRIRYLEACAVENVSKFHFLQV